MTGAKASVLELWTPRVDNRSEVPWDVYSDAVKPKTSYCMLLETNVYSHMGIFIDIDIR